MVKNPATVAYGPGLIGTLFNVMLYGIMMSQTFEYFMTYPRDKRWMKALVGGLFLIDTVNSIFDIWWIYDTLINHFGDDEAVAIAPWIFATDPAIVGIIATIVQLFFAWRVKVLTGNIWVVMFIIVTSLCSVFGGIGTAIAIHYVPIFIEFRKFKEVVIVWLIGAAVCDVAITIALSLYLRQHKTGFASTDGVLNRIMRLTVQNGLITAVWAILDLVFYLIDSSGKHLYFNLPLAKLYTNSLLSSLNSRAASNLHSSRSTNQKNIPFSQAFDGNQSTVTRPEVFVTVESHQMVDTHYAKGDIKWDTQASTTTKSKDLSSEVDSV